MKSKPSRVILPTFCSEFRSHYWLLEAAAVESCFIRLHHLCHDYSIARHPIRRSAKHTGWAYIRKPRPVLGYTAKILVGCTSASCSNQIQMFGFWVFYFFSSLVQVEFFFSRMGFESGTLIFSFLLLRDIMPVTYVLINLFVLAYDSHLILHCSSPQILTHIFYEILLH